MKLKLVVAMSVLGLISCPAFAADTTATTTKHKHKRMKHHHHHMVAAEPNYKGDFKGEMVQAPVVEACPINNWYTPAMDAMGQNVGRAKPTVDCYKPISFAGGINFDVHTFNLSKGYAGENNDRLSLNDAYLNIYGIVNCWTKAFMSISYNNASDSHELASGTRTLVLGGRYNSAYPVNTLTLEQGIITFANFDVSPVFVQLGKQYVDYGRYTIHPIEETMTQVLTKTLRTTAEVGFVTRLGMGVLHGDISAFDNRLAKTSVGHSRYIYGAALGFDAPSDCLGWDLGIGYLTNMLGVNDVAYAVNGFSTGPGFYQSNVGSIAAYGDINSGPFSLGARYTTALTRFSALDLTTSAAAGSGGAKPWSFDITAGYGFNYWNKAQNVYVGYQKSSQAALIPLPKSRWIVGYGVDAWQNTNFSLEYGHDQAYSAAVTGVRSTSNSNTLGLRAAVKFG